MIWINGQYEESPYRLSVFDKINLGMSVFTTLLAHKNIMGNIILHQGRAHYARLVRHADVIGIKMPYSESELLDAAGQLVRKMDGAFFAVRIQVTAGEGARGLSFPEQQTVFITVSPVDNPDDAKPVHVTIDKDIVLLVADPLNKIKSNYALRSLARHRAISEGFDDALLLNDMNAITSSTAGNVILKLEGVLKTPPLKDGVIDGICRATCLKNLDIRESSISRADFMHCDAAWIINSLGIRPIASIDRVAKPCERLE